MSWFTRKPTAKVAVVVRTRDRPHFLRRALESIAAQTMPDFTAVVVNDRGVWPELQRVVAPFAETLGKRLLVLNGLGGRHANIAAPLNQGLRATRSEFIAVHDDDDSWEPDFLRATVARLETESGARYAGVLARTTLVKESVRSGLITELSREVYQPWQERAVSLYRLAEENTIAPIGLLFRRRVLAEIGYRREDLGPLEDWEFNLRLFSRYPVAFLPELLANYHQRVTCEADSRDANFFGSSADLYGRLDIELRNELLRRDFAKGAPGLGWLASASASHGQLFQKVQELARRTEEKTRGDR